MRLLSLLSATFVALGMVTAEPELDHEQIQRSLEARTWAHETRDLLDAFGDLKTCIGCQSILTVLKEFVRDNDGMMPVLAAQLCNASAPYGSDFCDGVVERELPAISAIIKVMDMWSPSAIQFCMSFLGVCRAPKVAKWKVPFAVDKPCPYFPVETTSYREPIQIIHYSDVHVDPLYQAGASTECNKPICCRPYTENEEPGKSKNPAGPFGDHNCDAPISLEKSMYEYISKEFPKAAFSIFTGDIVDHAIWNTSQDYNEGVIKGSYGRMVDKLPLVYGTVGNHETHPVNIFEPKSVGYDQKWVYNTLADEWDHWIGNDTALDARDFGAYSIKYAPAQLRIISINTNLYYRMNFILYQNKLEKDPSGQFAWLIKELEKAEAADESVYIIGHMPMGDSDCLPDASNYFAQITRRFDNIIRGMFWGHTHVDSFQINYNDYDNQTYGTANIMSYIAPSLTPTSGHPAFKVYDVDPWKFKILDVHTYMADMDHKDYQTKGPVWKKYYSAKESYGHMVEPPMEDPYMELSAAFWHNVTETLSRNQTYFNEYWSRKSRGWEVPVCKHECRDKELCYVRAGRAQDNCWIPEVGMHFTKRDESSELSHSHTKHDDCGTAGTKDIFSALARRVDMLEMVQEHFLASGAKIQKPAVFQKRAEEGNSSSVADKPTQTDDSCHVHANKTGGGGGANKTTGAGNGNGNGNGTRTATGATIVPTIVNAASGLVPVASWIFGVLVASAFFAL